MATLSPKTTPHRCLDCGKVFKKKGNLTSHLSVHSNERLYECLVCNKAFKRKSHLKEHIRTHSDERTFVCSICDKSFKQSSSLSGHMSTHSKKTEHKCLSTHSKKTEHKCLTCNRIFMQKRGLASHLRMHTREHSYVCFVCQRMFNQVSDLQSHMGTHTSDGAKAFVRRLSATNETSIRRGGYHTTHIANSHNAKISHFSAFKQCTKMPFKASEDLAKDSNGQDLPLWNSTWNGKETSWLHFSGGPFVIQVKTEDDM